MTLGSLPASPDPKWSLFTHTQKSSLDGRCQGEHLLNSVVGKEGAVRAGLEWGVAQGTQHLGTTLPTHSAYTGPTFPPLCSHHFLQEVFLETSVGF